MSEIEQLMTVPPKPQALSRRDHLEIWVARVSGLIAVAALTLAIIVGLAGAGTSHCINDNLGSRSGPARTDAQAHIRFARDILRLFADHDSVAFRREVQAYMSVLTRDQQFRNTHPLGQC